MYVDLYTAGGDDAGAVGFDFYSPPEYYIGFCSTSWSGLPSTVPSVINKVWVITKLPGYRITVQCNGVTVLDLTMSDDTCSTSYWRAYWTRQIEQIKFRPEDTASDKYRAATPGNTLTIFNMTC